MDKNGEITKLKNNSGISNKLKTIAQRNNINNNTNNNLIIPNKKIDIFSKNKNPIKVKELEKNISNELAKPSNNFLRNNIKAYTIDNNKLNMKNNKKNISTAKNLEKIKISNTKPCSVSSLNRINTPNKHIVAFTLFGSMPLAFLFFGNCFHQIAFATSWQVCPSMTAIKNRIANESDRIFFAVVNRAVERMTRRGDNF